MAQSFCPQCGNPRQGTLRFCAHCGFDFWKAAAPDARPQNVQPSAQAPSPPPAVPQPGLPQPAVSPRRSGGQQLLRLAVFAVVVVLAFGALFAWLGGGSNSPNSSGAGLSEPTPTPYANRATPTPEATPQATPATFAPIKLTGRGNKVPKFSIPADAAAEATITNHGTANFIVTSLASDGSTNDLLVNVIGSYSGTVLVDPLYGEHSVALEVESNGSWTITIKPLSSAKQWDGGSPLTGKGDNVVLVNPPTSGLVTATFTHKGSANFVVTAYGTDGSVNLLVNEIGHYSGDSLIPDGTGLLQIEADGSWSVSP